MRSISFIILLIVAISCRNTHNIKIVDKHTYTDTLIVVDSLNYITTGIKQVLSNEIARKTLLEYFSKKKDYPEKMTLDSLLTYDFSDDYIPMCIEFDKLYNVHLNKDKF
jgi:hypothetical protein